MKQNDSMNDLLKDEETKLTVVKLGLKSKTLSSVQNSTTEVC